MKALVIKPKDSNELKLVSALLKRMGILSASITEEDLEDIGLSKLMRQVDKTKKASRAEVMKKLTA